MNPPHDLTTEPTTPASAGQVDLPEVLLAVDLGLRAGLAWFNRQGRLIRCRSTHFTDRATLRRALPALWQEVLCHRAGAGGGGDFANLAESARRRNIATLVLPGLAEELLSARRSARSQGRNREALQKVMRWSGYTRHWTTRHDASKPCSAAWMAIASAELPQWPPECAPETAPKWSAQALVRTTVHNVNLPSPREWSQCRRRCRPRPIGIKSQRVGAG